MIIERLSIDYFCTLCKTPFKNTRDSLSLKLEDLPREIKMNSCMKCHNSGGIEVTHIEIKEKKEFKYKNITKYIYTLKCDLCQAQWVGYINMSKDGSFSDIYDHIMQSNCITPGCKGNNKYLINYKMVNE